MAKRKHPTTSDAVQILYRRYYEGRPERVRGLEEARVNDSVARKLTVLRLGAGLTQRQLARLVGTRRQPSVDWKMRSMKDILSPC